MDVAAYTKELLYQERVVYVPGLGTFLTRKSAGVYNREQQRFYPPKNSIDFVEEEKQDDALEKYISENKNISTIAARYFIEKFAEQLKNETAIKNIPVKEVLFPAEAEALAEDPNLAPAFNMENFGLPPVSLPSKIKLEPLAQKPLPQENYVDTFYHELSNSTIQPETKHERNTGFWASVFLLLAVALLGCYTLYLYYPDLLNQFNGQKQTAKTVTTPAAGTIGKNALGRPQAKPETLATKKAMGTPKLALTKPATSIATVPRPPLKDTIAAAATPADPDLAAKSPYEIIGASFKTMNGAKAFLAQLKSKGMHRAKILSNTAGKQKLVTFGSYTDKAAASAALEKLRAKDPRSEAYIQHYIIK